MAERAFVTGALGFIGRAVAQRLREEGAEVRGVDVRADPAQGVVAGDIGDAGPWQEHAAGCDLVVHTAAVVSMRDDRAGIWRINALGTRRCIDAAVAAGARRFVGLSSVTVYSTDFPDGVGEDHPPRPDGVPYVDAKIAAEQAILHAHGAGEIEGTIVRPGDVYGPGSRPWTVLPVQEIAARRFLLPAWGKGIFSPVHVDDLVTGILLAARSDGAPGRVFNLTSGEGVPTREFFGHYARLLGRRIPLAPTPVVAALAGGVSLLSRGESEVNPAAARYLARTGTYSIARARERLGYEPRVSLAAGMEGTLRWLRDEGLAG